MDINDSIIVTSDSTLKDPTMNVMHSAFADLIDTSIHPKLSEGN